MLLKVLLVFLVFQVLRDMRLDILVGDKAQVKRLFPLLNFHELGN
jgi:hypothetical protein